jgi:GT2 family glycosyltransferase
MKVLVIIPTCGHFEYAKRAVHSFLKWTSDAVTNDSQFVIVDDASEEWLTLNWTDWPSSQRFHFEKRGGLTRSWNEGLRLALKWGSQYAICTNSDVLFSQGWFSPLSEALSKGFDLVGPLTNAPGHARWQNVLPFCYPDRPLVDDSDHSIGCISEMIRKKAVDTIEARINGFFMMAKTETWWRGAFSDVDVFDPKLPMVHNEVELQRRWFRLGFRVGVVPRSYIFHYRSVSRPEGLRGRSGGGAFRRPDGC